MRGKFLIRAALAAVLLAVCTTAVATAQPFDKRTFFTFNGPVAIPGVTLPEGKYLFRIADTSSRNVIQVLSSDGRRAYAMFFAFRAERSEPAVEPEIRFMETAERMPAAVKTWWYPAERSGYEFVYPKEQARRLARGIGYPVLATETPYPIEEPPTELEWISPSGEETPVGESGIGPALERAAGGATQAGEVAPQSIPIEPSPQTELPKTASALPIVGLVGLMLLLAGAMSAGWRMMRR